MLKRFFTAFAIVDFSPLLPSFNQHMRDGQQLIKCQPCSIRRRRFLHCFLNAPCQSSLADQNLDAFPLYFTSPANRPPSYPIVHASLQKYNATINHRCRLLGGDGGPDIFIGGEGDVTCVRAAANTSTANSSVNVALELELSHRDEKRCKNATNATTTSSVSITIF